MEMLILIAAAWGIVLLWHRAKPLAPAKNWVVVRLNRLYEWILGWRDKRPPFDFFDVINDWFIRVLAFPFWWLRGILMCGECLAPYAAFAVCFTAGFGWYASCIEAAAAYAGYVYLFSPKDEG